jgi:L-gulonate 3-dehydrogenase
MTPPESRKVAVVGAGVIGRSWALVFARAGCETRVYDPSARQLERATDWLEAELRRDRAAGLVTPAAAEACRKHVVYSPTLHDAVAGADYVQESGPEAIEDKRSIFAELDAAAPAGAILASSTSVHDPTVIAAGLAGAGRCLVAHPVNPPHVVPVVEVLPGRATTADAVERTVALLGAVGQMPVQLKRHVPGFLLNRMQAALLREAIHLVESGVADVAAVDAVIRDGLGLRWALLGPFGVANTNADDGIRGYLRLYAEAYRTLMADLGPTPAFDADMIERVGCLTDRAEGGAPVAAILAWRDRSIRRLRLLKESDPHPAAALQAGGNGEPPGRPQ